MKILIIDGPNLNLIGKREPELYGSVSIEEYLSVLRTEFHRTEIDYFQSNVEGEIINRLHSANDKYDGIVINAGGYTHTSVAIRDAIAAITTQVVEVHISSLTEREEFRHISLLAPVCKGSIMGFGLDSYRLGIMSLIRQ